MFSPNEIIPSLLSIFNQYMCISSETQWRQQMIMWSGSRTYIWNSTAQISACSQHRPCSNMNGTRGSMRMAPFHIFTLEVLFIIVLIGWFIPWGSFFWFHACYFSFNTGWKLCEYLSSVLWISTPSSCRCGMAEKLISPMPQTAACVLNVY